MLFLSGIARYQMTETKVHKVSIDGADNVKSFCLGYVTGETAQANRDAVEQLEWVHDRRRETIESWKEALKSRDKALADLEDHGRFIRQSRWTLYACMIVIFACMIYWLNYSGALNALKGWIF